MDLSSLTEKELQAEVMRRHEIKERERHLEEIERYRAERAAEEAKDREFAASIGITYEQYEDAESYVRNKIWEEQR